jgi:hypothetical protein
MTNGYWRINCGELSRLAVQFFPVSEAFERAPDAGAVVSHDNDEVAGAAALDAGGRGTVLIEYDSYAIPGHPRAEGRSLEQRGDRTRFPTSRVAIFPNDKAVKRSRRDACEGVHICIGAVAGHGNDTR